MGGLAEYFKQLILMETSCAEDTIWTGRPEEVCLWGRNTVQRRKLSEKCRDPKSLLLPNSLCASLRDLFSSSLWQAQCQYIRSDAQMF